MTNDFAEDFAHQQARGWVWGKISTGIEKACAPIAQAAIHEQITPERMAQLKHDIGGAIDGVLEDFPLPNVRPGSLWWRLKQHQHYPSSLRIYVVRNWIRHSMTEYEFKLHFGYPPAEDDLHRVCCDQAGEFGHFQCGWCMDHETARFACGCLCRVAPCRGGAWGSATSCLVHEGFELDGDGLCVEGRRAR